MGRQGSREVFSEKVNYKERIVERAWRASRLGWVGGKAMRGV